MKIVFISDIHLGAGYIADKKKHERTVCDFLAENCEDADQLYLLGDILDYWYEYRHVVPRGYVRFFGQLAELADKGVKITWLTGNHDIWLFDYISGEIGVEVIDSPYIEREIGCKKFVLSHGDRLISGSLNFRIISRIFRNRFCQRLYSAIHPRWTVPFAGRWSKNSRCSHQLADEDEEVVKKFVIEDSERFLKENPDVDFLIMGHHHLMIDEKMGKSRIMVLGDWIEKYSYAEYNGETLTLKRYKTKK